MTVKAKNAAQVSADIDALRVLFPAGSTVHTIIRHVSASGMQRAISVITPDFDDVSYRVARVLGNQVHRQGGVTCNGAGMDMAFHLVYSLSHSLYGDGYALRHRHI